MWIVLFSAALLSAGPEVDLRTVAGQTARGALISLSDTSLTLESSSGPRKFSTKELLSVAVNADPSGDAQPPSVWIELIDGSRLVGSAYRTANGKATLQRGTGEALTLSTKAVASVRLKEQSSKIAAQWAEIVAAPRAADVIVIRRQDAIDFQEGVVGNVSDDTVQFTLDGDIIDVKRPRVEGFFYFRAATNELPATVCQVYTSDGDMLHAHSVSLADNRLRITTPAGVELQPAIERIKQFDFSLGKLRFLSDLEPELVERTPYLGMPGKSLPVERYYEPRADRAFDGGPLRIDATTYEKGMALKSRTRMVYRVPGAFSRLEAMAGIDASIAPLGDVHLTIRRDESTTPLFEADVHGSSEALPISLDITGVKRLVIEVDFGQGGDVGDYLILGDARIIQ